MKPKAQFLAIIIHITFYLLHLTSNAQDVHFSQSNMTPLLLNPALTGVFSGDQRVFLNYKNQWSGMGMQGATYNTALFSFDQPLLKNKWQNGYLGAGITCYRDVAGSLKMGTTQINLSFAGIVYINRQQSLSGGLQGGFVQKSISASAIQWENQYDQSTGTFNSSLPSNDIISIPPVTYGDFSTGLAWNYSSNPSTMTSNDALKINAGIAMQNIGSPKQSFYSNLNSGGIDNSDELYTKFVVHGNALIGIKNTNLAVSPNALFYKQGPSYELNIGTLLRWTIKDESKYTGNKGAAFSAGLQYRLKDAIVPVILLEYANYALGLSYDVNVSGLTAGGYRTGGLEVSLQFLTPNPFRSAFRVPDMR